MRLLRGLEEEFETLNWTTFVYVYSQLTNHLTNTQREFKEHYHYPSKTDRSVNMLVAR